MSYWKIGILNFLPRVIISNEKSAVPERKTRAPKLQNESAEKQKRQIAWWIYGDNTGRGGRAV